MMCLSFWDDVLQLLEGSLREEVIALWIAPLTPIVITDAKLVLLAPNHFFHRIVEERYLGAIQRCSRALSGRNLEIELMTAAAASQPERGPGTRCRANPPSAQPVSATFNRNYTFDNFVVGRCNRTAYLAAISAAATPGKKHNPLFITGGVGLGKTHLLQAIGARSLASERRRCIFVPSDQLMDYLMEAIKNGTIAGVRKRFTSVSMLLVDDIHFLSGKNQVQEEFFRIFNAIYRKGCQIVLTSDRPPRDIPRLQQRLVSRFQSGSIAELKPPSLKTRVTIIERKSRLLGIELPHDVVMLLASRIRTNIRRIEGAINRIAAFWKLSGRPVNQEMVNELLKDRLFDSEGETMTMVRIQQKVAEHFNIKMSSLLGHGRSGSVVLPRQMAMYICRKLFNSPYADIGAAFSGRDHTTAIYACKSIEGLLRDNGEARETLDEIVTAIRS